MIGPMLKELITTPGAIAKKRILIKYDSADIREILKYTYDTGITYGVRANPTSPLSLTDRLEPLSTDEISLLEALRIRKLSGHAAQDAVNQSTKLVKLILARDLQCGVAATTINKAIPGCIPQFKVQLAKEVPLSKITFPMWAQLKYDGVRLITIVDNKNVTFKTRNGKVVHLPRLQQHIQSKLLKDCVLDGEIIVGGGSMLDRTSVSGLINSAMHGGRIDESKLSYILFDRLPLYEFYSGVCNEPYSVRYKQVSRTVELFNSTITCAQHELVKSAIEVNEMASVLYKAGLEGLILKDPNHYYSYKRSADWIKIKETKTADLKVYTWQEGTGKYEGMIGALYCKGIVEGKEIGVFVGTGLTDEDRALPPSYYMDETVEVKYNSIIRDSKTGSYSLFLPRFVTIRLDK